MPNVNPIKKSDPESFIEFEIPQEHASKTLSVSTTTTLDKEGWKLDLTHAIVFSGKAVNPNDGPDLDQQEIGECEEIDGKKLKIVSTAGRIKDTGTNPPPKAEYKLTFFVDEEELESFSLTISANPAKFYTKIQFKIV